MYTCTSFLFIVTNVPLEPVSVSLRGLNLKSPAIARAVTIYRDSRKISTDVCMYAFENLRRSHKSMCCWISIIPSSKIPIIRCNDRVFFSLLNIFPKNYNKFLKLIRNM